MILHAGGALRLALNDKKNKPTTKLKVGDMKPHREKMLELDFRHRIYPKILKIYLFCI